MDLVEIDWRAPLVDFAGVEAALLGTAWDYQDDPAGFIARLQALGERGIAVHNPPEVVRWNSDKRYLEQIGQSAPTVPTLWLDDVSKADVIAAMSHFQADGIVVKRQIGAGGIGQVRFMRDSLPADDWCMGRPAMLQPFLPSVVEEGEYSFLFIDGAFSHGVLKRAAQGEYRIQSLYGGYERDYTPTPADLAQAQDVIAAVPFAAPLYARVDMVRLPDGRLAVMEAEMIEPYLYPEQGPDLGERLAEALATRLGK